MFSSKPASSNLTAILKTNVPCCWLVPGQVTQWNWKLREGCLGCIRATAKLMAGKSVLEDDRKGKVFQGTCGWSDSSIVKCGRFYPGSVKTSEDRLLHYSRFFPCVECDSSNYAIPSPAAVEKWVKCVPAGFKFHFKAFGFFTRKVRVCLWARSF